MTIHLSNEQEQIILSLLQSGTFRSADEVIGEALRLVGQRVEPHEDLKESASRTEADEATDRTAKQLENLKWLGRKLDSMPTESVEDGLTNRDHDRILSSK
jgi:putative addiction module CopG family antidote